MLSETKQPQWHQHENTKHFHLFCFSARYKYIRHQQPSLLYIRICAWWSAVFLVQKTATGQGGKYNKNKKEEKNNNTEKLDE